MAPALAEKATGRRPIDSDESKWEQARAAARMSAVVVRPAPAAKAEEA